MWTAACVTHHQREETLPAARAESANRSWPILASVASETAPLGSAGCPTRASPEPQACPRRYQLPHHACAPCLANHAVRSRDLTPADLLDRRSPWYLRRGHSSRVISGISQLAIAPGYVQSDNQRPHHFGCAKATIQTLAFPFCLSVRR